MSFPSIVFWLLQSIFSFCVSRHWVSVLGQRSSILHDNKCLVMCEVRGKRWPKYITMFLILEKSSVQGSRGSTWNKYISMSYTKSYLRMLCSIYLNTSSFTIFDYIIWYGYKTTYITMVDWSHNIQWWVFKIWKLCRWTQHNLAQLRL